MLVFTNIRRIFDEIKYGMYKSCTLDCGLFPLNYKERAMSQTMIHCPENYSNYYISRLD